jgi:hypothetical protein
MDVNPRSRQAVGARPVLLLEQLEHSVSSALEAYVPACFQRNMSASLLNLVEI